MYKENAKTDADKVVQDPRVLVQLVAFQTHLYIGQRSYSSRPASILGTTSGQKACMMYLKSGRELRGRLMGAAGCAIFSSFGGPRLVVQFLKSTSYC